MLELAQKILKKVSFDPILFKKELKKSLAWITDLEELKKFKEWCIKEFYDQHPQIINQVLQLN